MTIRLDKCIAFGMMNEKNAYLQIKPLLTLNAGNIFTVPIDGQFTYLGRRFSFDLNHESVKQSLKNKLELLLKVTDSLKIKTQTKLRILSLYIHSQMLFELKLYDFPLTWVEQTLDAMCFNYIRDWMEMPISAFVKQSTTIPKNLGGLGIDSYKQLAKKM